MVTWFGFVCHSLVAQLFNNPVGRLKQKNEGIHIPPLDAVLIHPGKVTWNRKTKVWKMIILSFSIR